MPKLIERISGLLEKATLADGDLSALSCAVCQKERIVMTVFSNESHAILCQACWNLLRNAAPALMDVVKAAKEYRDALDACSGNGFLEAPRPYMDRVEAALAALRSKLAALEEL